MEDKIHIAAKLKGRTWLGKRTTFRTPSLAAQAAIEMANEEGVEYAGVLCRRWELARVMPGSVFGDVLERIGIGLAELPAENLKAPRGKRKLEVYEMLKTAFEGDRAGGYADKDVGSVATDFLVQLRPYLK